jgi:hypothetical protein
VLGRTLTTRTLGPEFSAVGAESPNVYAMRLRVVLQRAEDRGTQLRPYRYVVNLRSNVMHKLPSREKCNVDQIPREQRARLRQPVSSAQRCRHCYPKQS